MFDALNHEIGLSTTQSNVNGTNGRSTPYKSNSALCEMNMPAGENYSVGAPYIKLTNESYNFVYNSNGVHFISRVKGDGECEIVNFGCLDLSTDPERYIAPDFRSYMRRELVCPNRDGKYLVWTDGGTFGIGYMDVEASIATGFFTTPFFEKCSPDPCEFVRLCVPEICGCLHAEFIPASIADEGLSNNILDRGLKFMVKHVYYDGRESEWSTWSTLYYQETNACFNNNVGLSRCMKLRVPVGNAMVDKIKIAFSEDGGLTWFVCETVEKYKKYNDLQEKWYQRDYAELQGFSETDCAFDYIFCNDKERIQVPFSEVNRVRNPIPREVQGFFELNNSIAAFNYKDGVCPIDEKEVEKIGIDIICDNETQDCSAQFVTVTVRALIYNPINNYFAWVFRRGGNQPTDPDDPTDPAYMGGHVDITDGIVTIYGPQFTSPRRNLVVYIEGTNSWVEMKQYRADPGFINNKEFGIFSDIEKITTSQYAKLIGGPGYFYQEAKIRILKGTRGFLRLVSHEATDGSRENQSSSTYVLGTVPDIHNLSNNTDINASINKVEKEIYFDTCNGSVDLFKSFIVGIPNTINNCGYAGYVTDVNGLPVEGARLISSSSDLPSNPDNTVLAYTDYNGFYFFCVNDASFHVKLNVEISCSLFATIQTLTLLGTPFNISDNNALISDIDYSDNFMSVEQKLLDCKGNPVPGITISMYGSKSRVTDVYGIAHLRMRNYATRDRIIHTVVMNDNGCFTVDCNNQCSPCMPSNSVQAPLCFVNNPTYLPSNLVVNVDSIFQIKKGLKAGGSYPFGIVVQGDCGRLSASYLVKYLNIPRTQVKGNLGFCSYSYDLTGVVFPSWASCVKIVRGNNENPFELQWIVDKIQRTADGKIKLTIQSLNDYNQKYFFQSNTVYQWLKGDRIEFIRNGDGSILTTGANGILNYLTISPFHDKLISGQPNADANYFNQLIIEDDNRLGSITQGAIIELQRPKISTAETTYFDICVTIPVINGVAETPKGFFSTFDTYIINRTSGSFLGYFESKYPSDFWGQTTPGVGLDDTGKRYIVNKYETEKRYGQNISVNSPTVFNYFGDIIKTVCPKSFGDITAMNIWDGQIILGIAEHDNFLAQSAQDLLQVAADGSVRALPADAIISNAQPKTRGQFGCQYDSIGAVAFGDGWSVWVDANKDAHVKHDFNEAVEVSLGKTQTFFRKKCQELRSFNATQTESINKLRFVSGQNQLNAVVMTTIKRLRHPAVNNSFDPYANKNVTLNYHPASDTYLSRASFTPEAYSMVNLSDDEGCAFISFFNGVPYVHPKISNKHLEFFGITCDWMVGVTMNQPPEKDKTALSFELQSMSAKWFVSKVTTENPNFISEIPVVRIKRDKDKCNGAFLNNKNSRGGLYGGTADVPRGYFVNVQFVRDNTIIEQYATLDNVKRQAYSELGEIFFKFKENEQSGFDQNL